MMKTMQMGVTEHKYHISFHLLVYALPDAASVFLFLKLIVRLGSHQIGAEKLIGMQKCALGQEENHLTLLLKIHCSRKNTCCAKMELSTLWWDLCIYRLYFQMVVYISSKCVDILRFMSHVLPRTGLPWHFPAFPIFLNHPSDFCRAWCLRSSDLSIHLTEKILDKAGYIRVLEKAGDVSSYNVPHLVHCS